MSDFPLWVIVTHFLNIAFMLMMARSDGPQGHDFDTHGIFDDRSTLRRYQLWASQHHALLATVGAGAVALVGVLATRAGTPRLGQTGS